MTNDNVFTQLYYKEVDNWLLNQAIKEVKNNNHAKSIIDNRRY